MKKSILLLLFLPSILVAQRIEKKISEKKFGTVDCVYSQSVENGDTTYFLFCSFQNAEYQHIIDIGSLMFTDQIHLDSFITDLEGAYVLMMDKERQNVTYDRGRYKLQIYDFAATTLYIFDDEGKRTTMPRRLVEQWIEWLKTIKFPSE